MSAAPTRRGIARTPELMDLIAAVQSYRRAQRRRDTAYDRVLDEIRLVASGECATLTEIAQACGFTTTHIRKIVEGPVSRRDRLARWPDSQSGIRL